MKNLIIIILAFLLSSCANSRLVTETKTWVEYRDTVITLEPIPVRLPESDIKINMLLQVENNQVNLPVQTFAKGVIKLDVSVVDNELRVNAYLTDSTILVKPDPVRIENAIKEERKEKTVPVKYIPSWYKWANRIVLIEIILLLLYFGQKFSGKNILSMLFSVFSKRGA